MTADQIRAEREAREAGAALTASRIEPGDYYASGLEVKRRDGIVVATCATHWDACLVMLRIAKG